MKKFQSSTSISARKVFILLCWAHAPWICTTYRYYITVAESTSEGKIVTSDGDVNYE